MLMREISVSPWGTATTRAWEFPMPPARRFLFPPLLEATDRHRAAKMFAPFDASKTEINASAHSSYCLRTGEKATDDLRCSGRSFEHGRMADIGDDPDGDIGHGSITIAGLCASVHLIALTEYDECRRAQLAESRV